MAESKGGVWRRDKKGNLTQVQEPAAPQKYGAHDRHPATVKGGAESGSKGQQQSARSSVKQENSGNADT